MVNLLLKWNVETAGPKHHVGMYPNVVLLTMEKKMTKIESLAIDHWVANTSEYYEEGYSHISHFVTKGFEAGYLQGTLAQLSVDERAVLEQAKHLHDVNKQLVEALQNIANLDYRGNREHGSVMAYKALKKLNYDTQ
jgi:hypothetical protein